MSILPGITRDTIIHIGEALGYTVEEALLIRTDLYLADEVFMVGTATEVAPVRAVDDREIGVGPVTRELQKAYLAAVHGVDDRWRDWLDVVEVSRSPAAA
jgi:branched-chain amino acid aminotransferase